VSKKNLNQQSTAITDERIIGHFVNDPDNPFLVSFPRTGSHWLRMLMELYFERPSLVRVFFYPDCPDYLTLHTHDLDLDVRRKSVIYLYRDPAETIFSQLKYHREDTRDVQKITEWSRLYGSHLYKWLVEERFTEKKTVINYERLQKDLEAEFRKVVSHFNRMFDEDRLREISQKVDKNRVKKKTKHDKQVITISNRYETERQHFMRMYSQMVRDVILTDRAELGPFLNKQTDEPIQ